MKQILIRHADDICAEHAMRYAWMAWRNNPYCRGVVAFRDGIIVEYSDRSKYPSLTVFRDKQDNGLKATEVIMEEKK